VRVTLQEEAVAQAVRRLGWRVYATTQPRAQLSLEQAVLAYREEYVVERGMGRLKGRPLSVAPLYLQDEAHVTGLIRLLVLALRVLTLLEYTVRRQLAIQHDQLTGLYAGNPKRATARPTAEALLRAFQDITLSAVTRGGQTQRHVTPLSCVHQRILELLDFSPSIYASLAADASRPP
jgi:transposase